MVRDIFLKTEETYILITVRIIMKLVKKKIEAIQKVLLKLFNIQITKSRPNLSISRPSSIKEYIHENKTEIKFFDEQGDEFYIIKGFKDIIKPNWRSMLSPPNYSHPSKEKIISTMKNAKNQVNTTVEVLNRFGYQLNDLKVLEIGCYDGSKSIALKNFGCKEVIGSDVTAYYINQTASTYNNNEENVRNFLDNTRKNFIETEFGNVISKNISFVEDDILQTNLPPDSFDLIVSWECFEHFTNPQLAMKNIYRLLKPGGISFHHYNPFFSLDGGHSLCTIDIPWGHVALSPQGFSKYFQELRPDEKDLSESFYINNLNRMTMNDFRMIAEETGFYQICFLYFPQMNHFEIIEPTVFKKIKKIYPTIQVEDLISPEVLTLYQKPSGSVRYLL